MRGSSTAKAPVGEIRCSACRQIFTLSRISAMRT
jgi:hypothetical protein